MLFRCATGAALLAVALAAPAAAQQAQSAPDQRTMTVFGTGTVAVERPARPTDRSIAAAIERAKDRVAPAALAAARTEAVRLGYAARLTVGELVSVSDTVPAGFGFYGPFSGAEGTFGPGRYCGTVSRPIVRVRNGRRQVVGRRRSVQCRVPPAVSRTIQATYAVSPKA